MKLTTKITTVRKMAAAGTALALLTTACGGSDADLPDPTFVFLGRYVQTITADDPVPPYLIGTIEWSFREGEYRVTFRDDDQLWISGSYAVDGNELTITEEDGPRQCDPGTESATYFWSVDGDDLLLSPSDEPDLCDGRKEALPAVPFKR